MIIGRSIGGRASSPRAVTRDYTGIGAARSLSCAGGIPGLIWTKRTTANNHALHFPGMDTGKFLFTNGTFAETVDSGSYADIISGGYKVGASTFVNESGATYSNLVLSRAANEISHASHDGEYLSLDGKVSYIKYTGTGVNRTITHSLGAVPAAMIVKSLSTASDWAVYMSSIAATQYYRLNLTNANSADSTIWNDTTPTSSVFSVGTATATNANTEEYVAMLIAPGNFTKIDNYVGNGLVAGPTETIGMRPNALMVFKRGASGPKVLLYSPSPGVVYRYDLNVGGARSTADSADFTNTGFQIITTDPDLNNSGTTFDYIALG